MSSRIVYCIFVVLLSSASHRHSYRVHAQSAQIMHSRRDGSSEEKSEVAKNKGNE